MSKANPPPKTPPKTGGSAPPPQRTGTNAATPQRTGTTASTPPQRTNTNATTPQRTGASGPPPQRTSTSTPPSQSQSPASPSSPDDDATLPSQPPPPLLFPSDAEEDSHVRHDFEMAITACGFGKFNVLLLMVAGLALAATIFESSTMSYILPTAECDLHLSLLDKGMLNAITYAGMIVSAVPWGFIADTVGRKKVLVSGLLASSVAVICSACSQNTKQLMIFKFFCGFIACGPFAIIMSYISEFHGKQHRSTVMMFTGIMKTTALLLLPILAYSIMPHHIKFKIFDMRFHTWQVFMGICAIPGTVSGLLLLMFPESPKFLMSQGRNEEALKAFQRIYALNTGKQKDTFPVKALFEEAPEKTAKRMGHKESKQRSRSHRARSSLVKGFTQLRPMFSHPFLSISMIVYVMDFCVLTGQNSVRLWLPQIFASIVEYEAQHHGASSMCTILAYNVNKTKIIKPRALTDNCDIHITAASYTNNIIVAGTGYIGFFLASSLVHKVGNRNILSFTLFVSCLCGFSFYFSTTELSTLILAACFVTNSSVAATTLISVVVNVFPTSMRTMVVILIMTFGRFGSLIGNILFPIFMSLGCIPPFVMVGGMLMFSFLLSLFLPNTHKMPLR